MLTASASNANVGKQLILLLLLTLSNTCVHRQWREKKVGGWKVLTPGIALLGHKIGERVSMCFFEENRNQPKYEQVNAISNPVDGASDVVLIRHVHTHNNIMVE